MKVYHFYKFVSNGKIVTKYIFSCAHCSSVKLNDKLIVVKAQLLLLLDFL